MFKLKKRFFFQQMNDEEILKSSMRLSIPEAIMESYLPPEWKNFLKSFQTKETKLEGKLATFKEDIGVKLVFLQKPGSGTSNSKTNQSIANFFSPILKTSSTEEYYPALIVGPWLLEWNPSEVVIPTACTSENAALAVDISSNVTIENVESMLKEISKNIVEWNTKKQFSLNPNDPKQGNSFDFVEDLTSVIGVSLPTKGPIGEFLSSAKKSGLTKFEYNLSFRFKNHYKIQLDTVKFKTHSDLDEFVDYLVELDGELELKFPQEFEYLKGLDRGFWMKESHVKETIITEDENTNIQSPKMTPRKNYEICCPFGDPKKTKSFFL
jgi:hypothetical protein